MEDTRHISARRTQLSDAKRALLEERLKRKAPIAIDQAQHSEFHTIKRSTSLSPAQRRLWFLDQMYPGNPVYNEFVAFQLEGTLNIQLLERSLKEIISRHEILRTTFQTHEKEPCAISTPVPHTVLSCIDIRSVQSSEQDLVVLQLLQSEVGRPFTLATGPLLRLYLFQLTQTKYILTVTMHHIICDAWSGGIFVHELEAFYRAFSHGKPSSFLALPMQYTDYARDQLERLQGKALEAQRSYWKKQLHGVPEVLSLPIDHSRPAIQRFHGAAQQFRVPEEITIRLKRLSQREGATLFMTLLSVLYILIYRYTAEDDIVIGAPIVGRNSEQMERIIGLFVNTLLLRANLSGDPHFLSLLRQVRKVTIDAYTHQDLPFEALVEMLRPERSMSYTPLCQVVFAHYNDELPILTLNLPDVAITPLRIEHDTTRFDLSFITYETNNEIRGVLEYDTDLFEAATIQRMLGHLLILLECIVEKPEQRIAILPLLTPGEYQQLLNEWNTTSSPFPEDSCVHKLFEEQVIHIPHAIALVSGEMHLTYKVLNQQANLLAHSLIGQGVIPGDLIGLCTERSCQMIIGILGILKAGGAYVPLDPGYPPERIAFMLTDAQISLLLIQPELEQRLPEHTAKVVYLNPQSSTNLPHYLDNPECLISGDDLFYVIYTSGSTGRPKGAGVYRRGFINLMHWMVKEFDFSQSNRVLVFTTLNFDLTQKNIFAPLIAGGTLYLTSSGPFDHEEILELLVSRHITAFNCTPSAFYTLVDEAEHYTENPWHSLRYVFLGGEPIAMSRLTGWIHGRQPGAELVNTYGPTECSDLAAIYRMSSPELFVDVPVPVGTPISNVQLYILDVNYQLVPIGVPGEVYIGGVSLGAGYLRRPTLTAERFFPHPYSTEPGQRLYRTGDLARYHGDGTIEFLRRIDYQVKVRGFRVELDEIEAALMQHPDVKQAVVVAHEHQQGSKRLIAYFVPGELLPLAPQKHSSIPQEELLADQPHYELPNGLLITYQTRSETEFLYQEIFEHRSYLQHGIVLEPGCCVFDIGANIGLFTLFVSQEVQDATIYAFEPMPAVFKKLRINTSLHHVNVKLFECGIASQARTETFTYYPHLSIFSGRFADSHEESAVIKDFLRYQQDNGQKDEELSEDLLEELLVDRLKSEHVVCAMKSISDVIRENNVEKIDLLKIDAEKSEIDILEGINDEDWPKIKQVVIEVLNTHNQVAQIVALLHARGFSVQFEQDDLLAKTDLYNIYATRPLQKNTPHVTQSVHVQKRALSPSLRNSQTFTQDVQAFLRGKLPDYMLPTMLIPLEKMPLTPNGKVDRKALPSPEVPSSVPEKFLLAPRTPVEEILADLWMQLLGSPQIGINENFFDLGGHSLLATQLVSRIRNVFEIELPLGDFFVAPTIESLAQYIVAGSHTQQELSFAAIERVSREQSFPLSFAQQRLWFFNQIEPGNSVYNVPFVLRMSGQLHLEAFQRSLDEVVKRHEILRTTFSIVQGLPSQNIMPVLSLPFAVIDLQHPLASEREMLVLNIATNEVRRPFDLEYGPLLRVLLLRVGPEEHVFVLTIHHIVSDAWSQGVFFQELAALYTAFSYGGPSPLPVLSIQYADYSLWQRHWFQGEVLERQLAYWTAQLAGTPDFLNLPTDHPRPIVQSYRGALYSQVLPLSLCNDLLALSRREQVTLFMTMLSAFQILLMRYSGQTDIVVGTPIANRHHLEIEPLIGFFVNMLVLRTSLAGDPTVRELLARVRQVALGAYAHQDLPFEQVVDALQPQRNLGHAPLFQVLFLFQNVPFEHLELPELRLHVMEVESTTAKFDLTLALTELPEGMQAQVEYNTDLFEASTIQRLLAHFQIVLEAMVRDPQQSIGNLPLLTQVEQDQVLAPLKTIRKDEIAEGCLHELFERQVERTPEAIALVCGQEQLTYALLNQRANQLARSLQGLGVGPEVVVALCLPRSLDMLIGLLAILKAGGAYLPIDPTTPAERLALLLRDAHPQVLLIQHERSFTFLPPVPHILSLQHEGPTLWHAAHTTIESPVCSQNLAYLLYTSGSTGTPKGVLLSHQGVVNLGKGQAQMLALDASSRILQFASLTFDASVWEIVMAWQVGACLHLVPAEQPLVGSHLLHVLDEQAISIVTLPPSILATLPPAPLPLLRTLIVAGEACPAALLPLWGTGRSLVNAYGPTETTVCATMGRWHGASCWLPLGHPLPHTHLLLLDERLRLVPVGVVGEIFLGGPQLARGYHQQAQRTAESFVPHPFSHEPGARLYRTGDLARSHRDGSLEFVGRRDRQVKVRGVRIELGEIEALLQEHPAIQGAIVRVWEKAEGDQRLVAYVVLRVGEPWRWAEMRQYLRERLPDVMVPALGVVLAQFPLTANGKIDQARLPRPEDEGEEGEAERGEPTTEVEMVLASLWAQVLGRKRVGIHESFFDLGGHSLLATQLISRITAEFGMEMPLRSLFEAPRVVDFARLVLTNHHNDQESQLLLPQRQGSLPLSFAQKRLWFLAQLNPTDYSYNVQATICLAGMLRVQALTQSLDEIVKRHQVLRTTFVVVGDQPQQVVAPIAPSGCLIVDLTALAQPEKKAAIVQISHTLAVLPIDLAQGPLFHTLLLRESVKEHTLIVKTHHIVFDGWSTKIFNDELGSFYKIYCRNQPSCLPELPIQYSDFAAWQHHRLASGALEPQLVYWQRQLEGFSPLALPYDRPRTGKVSSIGATYAFDFPVVIVMALRRLCAEEDVTLFMLLIAAFDVLIYFITSQEDIVVGTDIAGRNRSETEGLIGFFVNILALRIKIQKDVTFQSLLQQIKEMVLDAYENQEAPFDQVVERLHLERGKENIPLIQALFVLQNVPQQLLQLEDMDIHYLDEETSTARFDLALFVEEIEGTLRGNIKYRTDLFNEKTIAKIVEDFMSVLQVISSDTHKTLGEIELHSHINWRNKPMLERQENDQKKLKIARRRSLSLSSESLIETSFLTSSPTLPLVIQPAIAGVNLISWAMANQEFIETSLLQHGALLFRGFNDGSAADFELFARAIAPDLFGDYGDLPREGVGDRIYTSTPYPADQTILFHNESSHMHQWPTKIWFFCAIPAEQGGATPIVDCRELCKSIDGSLLKRLEEKKIMYVRSFLPGFDVSWQSFFQTTDKQAVNEICRQTQTECIWINDILKTKRVGKAITTHPKTGEKIFFNQIQLYHMSFLEREVRESILSIVGSEHFPRTIYYGDGTPIEESVIQEISAAYRQTAVRFSWQKGDILMLDNMLVAHARDPFVGTRKILVAMAHVISG